MESGPQRGQANFYADQWTDISRQYAPEVQNLVQQYGQEAVNNPAFMRKGGVNFQEFNPFDHQNKSGTVGPGFNWEFNPFTGLSGVDQGLDYLRHYTTHHEAARKGAQDGVAGDQAFFSRYGMNPQSGTGSALYGGGNPYGGGSALYGASPDARMSNIINQARGDYNELLKIQKMYGY